MKCVCYTVRQEGNQKLEEDRKNRQGGRCENDNRNPLVGLSGHGKR